MESMVFQLSARFHEFLFQREQEDEPLLVINHMSARGPGLVFCVRFTLGDGAGGENCRPIFRNELTAYDYDNKIMYPTQRARLEKLQTVMESAMYGQPGSLQAKVMVEDESVGTKIPAKAVISEELFSKLVDLYGYAW